MSTAPYAAPMGSPRVRAFAAGGVPAAGGKVYVYQAGTTTADTSYPTYADALAGTNAQANPVVLDSKGEATIFLQTGRMYKIVCQDASGNVLWTVDSYTPSEPQYYDPCTVIAAVKSGDQTGFASATKVTPWTEQIDSNSEFSTDTFTCAYAGNYLVTAAAELSDTSASQDVILSIYKNGSEVKKCRQRSAASGGNHTTIVTTHALSLAASDTIDVRVTGTVNTTVYGTTGTSLTITRVSRRG